MHINCEKLYADYISFPLTASAIRAVKLKLELSCSDNVITSWRYMVKIQMYEVKKPLIPVSLKSVDNLKQDYKR